MKKTLFMACIALATSDLVAHTAAQDGGIVKLAGKGRIAIVDCGSGIEWERMKPAFEKFDAAFHVELVRIQGKPFSVETAADAVVKTESNAAVFVGNIDGYPMALSAPEQRWSFFNVASLKADGGNFYKRCQIMLMRGIYRAIGSDASQATKSVMSPVHSPKDLDVITDLDVAMDTYMGVCQSFDAIGIVPVEYGSYQDACEVGVAPPPTNDIQRAIWQKVHEPPSEPIRIKYKKTR